MGRWLWKICDMEYYGCKLDRLSQLILHSSEHVRWLSLPEDFPMLRAYYLLRSNEAGHANAIAFAENMSPADFPEDQWKLCAWVEEDEIRSMAGVIFMTKRNWEIGAVHTHPQYRGKGCAKAVCAFAAEYILRHGKRATCSTALDNVAMRRVMQNIGMVSHRAN